MKKMRHSGEGKMLTISYLHAKNTSDICHGVPLTTGDPLINFESFYSRKTKIEPFSDLITVKQLKPP